MNNVKILWADDEIDHLKAHLLFLKERGYEVTTVTNGLDATDKVKEESTLTSFFWMKICQVFQG